MQWLLRMHSQLSCLRPIRTNDQWRSCQLMHALSLAASITHIFAVSTFGVDVAYVFCFLRFYLLRIHHYCLHWHLVHLYLVKLMLLLLLLLQLPSVSETTIS